MRKLCSLFAALALVVCVSTSPAEDKKEDGEKTLKGVIQCNKCHLKKASKCETCIVVKEKDKEVVYLFDADAHKKHHGKVCEEKHEGEVVGKVKKDGDKWIVTVTKVTFK